MSKRDADPPGLDWRESLAIQRREAREQAIWTIPGASLAAQAFLYTGGLGPDTSALARLLLAIVGLVTAAATIQILLEQGYRMEVFRQFVHARRRARGAESIRRRDMRAAIEALEGDEQAAVDRFTRNPAGKLLIERTNAFATWLWVMAVFAAIDLFLVAIAVLELAGVWNPLSS